MNLEDKMKKVNEEALEILQNSDDKKEAILQAIEKITTAKYSNLIEELKEENEKSKVDAEYAKSLNLRTLSKEDKEFYEKLRSMNQSVTFAQPDIIPSDIIDRTVDDLQTEIKISELINFAPANVKKWITGSYTGVASWHGLTDELKGELEAAINGVNIEDGELDAYLVIPKAISDLALPFVDKFFNAILKEALVMGIEDGFCNGTGVEEPIGIYKDVDKTNENKTHQDKEVATDLTSFKPKDLAGAKKYLTKGGKRTISKLYLICNPNDEADYVAPAIYNDRGELISSYKNIEVLPLQKNPQGKAALVLPKKYTMGFNGFTVKKYDQTLALKNADLLVGTAYANGRPDDNNTAYVFDVTKLEEYIPAYMEVVKGA